MEYETLSLYGYFGALVLYVVASLFYFQYLAFRTNWAGQVGTIIAAVGVLVHASSIGFRWAATWADRGWHLPFSNMYEYTSFFAFFIMLSYLIIQRLRKTKVYGGFAAAVSFILMGIAYQWYTEAGPLMPALKSYWLDIHVFAMVVSSGVLGVGFVFAMLYLLKNRSEGKGAPRISGGSKAANAEIDAPPVESGIMSRFPTAKIMDHLSYRTIAFGFPIWTLGIIAGAVWAEQAWGRYWGWDAKETWSFITWLIYAGYLHARITVGWRGSRAAILATLGFVAVLVTFFAVNLWISGLHSYA